MSKVKIVYEDIAPGASAASTNVVNDKQTYSDLDLLKVEHTFPKYSYLGELNQCILDGSQVNFAETDVGWWSTTMSDENGKLNPVPVLTITFSRTISSVGITLEFDSENGVWANDIDITWYKGVTQLSTQNFNPDESLYFCQKRVENYDKIDIAFNSLCLPLRFLKLHQVQIGVVRKFNDLELTSVDAITEINQISEEISINTVDFSVTNKTDIQFMFQKKQKIQTFFDNELQATTFITEHQRTGKNTYHIESEDYINLLDTLTHVGGMYVDKNVEMLITEICGDIPVEVSDDVKAMKVTGWLPYASKRVNLQQVAYVTGAVVDTTKSDNVRVYLPSDSVTKTFTEAQVRSGTNVQEEPPYTHVYLTTHNYVQTQETEELFKNGTGNGLKITFSEPHHSLSITNGSIIENGVNYAIINANSGCVLSGKKYSDITSLYTISDPLFATGDIENPIEITDVTLINPDNVQSVAQRVYKYYSSQKWLNCSISGDFDVGELITVATDFLGNVTGRVEETTFNLNGNKLVKQAVIKLES